MKNEKKEYTIGYPYAFLWMLMLLLSVSFIALIYILYYAILSTIRNKEWIIFIIVSFLGLYISIMYFISRPRAIVLNQDVIYYPRWAKKTYFHMHDITSRTIEKGDTFSIFAEIKFVSSYQTIIYYHENTEIFKVSTSLPNAYRFDEEIVHYLQEKSGS